ncbi:MAG: O-antigen ligase family protein [Acidobacteria bacterium]|nr:O-antigen ligase family protein [Acidobacteriota bacterium]
MKLLPAASTRSLRALAEAVLLSTVCLVPVFFNPYSKRCFDPDRSALLRGFAFVAAACLAGYLWARWTSPHPHDPARKGDSLDQAATRGILGAIGFYLFSLTLSTLFSLSPSTSFFGPYDRGGGLLTVLSGMCFFVLIRVFVTTRPQMERVLLAMVAVSVPVAVYAICQRAGFDAVKWSNYFNGRVGSTLGNPIFLGSFILLTFMVTLRQLWLAARDVMSHGWQGGGRVARVSLFGIAALLQLTALLLSGSRGPFLALFAALLVIGILLLLQRGKVRAAVVLVGVPALAAGMMMVGQRALDKVQVPHHVSHLFRLLDAEEGNSRVRLLIWRGLARMAVNWSTLSDAEGNPDRFTRLRPLLGYGPETVQLVFDRYYSPELGRLESRAAMIDRCHNESWEALACRGWVGLLAQLGLFLALFSFGVHQLGLSPTRRHRRRFLLYTIGAGIGGGLLLSLLRGPEYGMLGTSGGLVAGILLYLFLFARRLHPPPHPPVEQDLTVVFLFGGVIGFFVETQFGFSTVTTTLWFWVFSGLLVAAPACFRHTGPEHGAHPPEEETPPDTVWIALTGSVTAFSLFFSLSSIPYPPTGLFRQFIRILSGPAGIILAVTLLWSALAVAATGRGAGGWRRTLRRQFAMLAVFTVPLAFFGMWVAWLQSASTRLPLDPPAARVARAGAVGNVLGVVIAGFAVIVVLVAIRLRSRSSAPPAGHVTDAIPGSLAGGLIAVAVIAAWFAGFQGTTADRFAQEAEFAAGRQSWDLSVAAGMRAHLLAREEPVYAANLGRYYQRKAMAATSPTLADKLAIEAEHYLGLALFHCPWRATYTLTLADLYQWRAAEAVWPGAVQVYADKADRYYLESVRLAPYNPIYRNNRAKLYIRVLQQPERAMVILQGSLQLDPLFGSTHLLLGECFYAIGSEHCVGGERYAVFRRALNHYLLGFQYGNPWEIETPAEARLNMARLCVELGDKAGFTAQNTLALKSAAADEREWITGELLRLERRLARRETFDRDGHPRRPKHSTFRRYAPAAERENLRKTAVPVM